MLVVHRDFPGEHETDERGCWCDPILIEDDDMREGSKIADEIKKVESIN